MRLPAKQLQFAKNKAAKEQVKEAVFAVLLCSFTVMIVTLMISVS